MTGIPPRGPVDAGGAAAERIAPMGQYALVAEMSDGPAVLAVADSMRIHPLPGQIDVVPGAESLVVVFGEQVGPVHVAALAARCASVDRDPAEARLPGEAPPGAAVTLETVYDGADLAEVAHSTGLSVDGIIAAHTEALWRVAFCGFAPGFAYLTGGDPQLDVPRRATPRTAVPSGAVGLAGTFSGIYPRESPGGWQLIGHTDAALWDVRRDPPALLRPGRYVQFRAVRERLDIDAAHGGAPPRNAAVGTAGRPAMGDIVPSSPSDPTPTLTVLQSGAQCLIEDLGRLGHAEVGVGCSGAADRGALRAANTAAGNPAGAAALEIVLGGLEIQVSATVTVGLAGAPVAVAIRSPDGEVTSPGADARNASYQKVSNPMNRPLAVPAGSRLKLGRPREGLRTYLAVNGGIAAQPTLGSRATDLLTGLGPAPVRAGDVLAVGPPQRHVMARPLADTHCLATAHPPADTPNGRDHVAILPGPQRHWFTDEAWQDLLGAPWSVSLDSNRVAVRLVGPTMHRAVDEELASQGLVRGAVQVPPSGELVAFLADYPVTGGYPVIAVLTDAATDSLAQRRPGSTVRFRDATA